MDAVRPRVLGPTLLLSTVLAAAVTLFAACTPPVPPGNDFAPRRERAMSGPTNEDECDGVASAPDGSVYVPGRFEQRATLGGVTLTSSGPSDCVVMSVRPDGSTRWARAFGGPDRNGCNGVTIDPSGASRRRSTPKAAGPRSAAPRFRI